MSAPAGLCSSCGAPQQWTFIEDELFVRCRSCVDLFEVGTEVAGDTREGREAVMPDGRPCRSASQIAMDHSFCKEGV